MSQEKDTKPTEEVAAENKEEANPKESGKSKSRSRLLAMPLVLFASAWCWRFCYVLSGGPRNRVPHEEKA